MQTQTSKGKIQNKTRQVKINLFLWTQVVGYLFLKSSISNTLEIPQP